MQGLASSLNWCGCHTKVNEISTLAEAAPPFPATSSRWLVPVDAGSGRHLDNVSGQRV